MKRIYKKILLVSILLVIFIANGVYAVNTTSKSKNNNQNTNSVNEVFSNSLSSENKNGENEVETTVQPTVEKNVKAENDASDKKESNNNKGIAMIAAALSTGLACLGAGIAVALVASSAVGAISENPGLLGKTIIFAGLAEGIAIYGLIISIMILNQA